ncbi:ABC transporter substrate-binding protein [Candidatus Formimonas warabiya]|uniref:ABC transporter substrate-binding protein n=1 Tax=Formimonas warabiya TaxID=1761012 RepID=A0A3G1L0A3_FORW1|nr:ABC transporter substrate-binding protein [Candidatus Formimonas warabiya]ATW28087.1 ABC transporter substrate-binding protein [Candidatus Formimonas warabiya]
MKRVLWIFLVLILALGATGCGSSSPSAGSGKQSEKTVIVGLQAEPTTLDASQVADYNTSRAAIDIYDQLVEFKTESTEIEPGLAEKWDMSDDGLEYTFYLRKDVKFHDGTPFNAEAVKFTINRQIDPNHPYHDTGEFAYADLTFGPVKEVQVVDDYTVKIILKEPFSPFLSNMAMHSASIVSPAAVEKYGKDFTRNPVGTGPLKFVSWTPGVEVILEKNPDYFKGSPKIDKVIFKPIVEDQTRVTELEAGNLDLIVNVPPDDLIRIQEAKQFPIVEQPGMHVWFTTFNCQKKPFNDVKVRQAINYAIDKEAIVKNILQDTGEMANSPLPSIVWGHNFNLKNYEYNPEKAQQLLDEAGYPDGFSCSYWIPESGSGMQQPTLMAAAIQADLAKVGIQVEIQKMEWGTYLDKVYVAPEKSELDMHQMSFIGDNGDPDNFLYGLLSGEQIPPVGFNDSYYQNPEVDKLLKEARKTADHQERAQMYEQVQEMIMADAPWVAVDYEKQIVVTSPRLKNFKLQPNGVFRFAQVDLE